jgi:5-formyltetrahydrofolate cyclo-ligase
MWLILDRIRREFPHIRISIPKVNSEKNELENFFFEGMHQLAVNDWGIQEPKQGVPTEPEKIDMVLVPLLVFDEQGNRVGYGKGYYDRFLKKCSPEIKKVGISLFPPVEQIPVNEFDVPLNSCVTPSGVIQF